MRVIAILAVYNEERFIAGCLEHLFRQGVEAYLIDNGSTDRTVAIAQTYLGHGLHGIETFPRGDTHRWRALLERKEQLAAGLEADWFMHVDADERHFPPAWSRSLAEAFRQVAAEGYNAVNFIEFTFLPTVEEPDHDHPDFEQTMRWYYPFVPAAPFLMRAWQRQEQPVELAWSAGHLLRFAGLRLYPVSFGMRHYLFLSLEHLQCKYGDRRHDPQAVAAGWHGWRARVRMDRVKLPWQADLRPYRSDSELDASNPRTTHYLADLLASA
jgi:hypothetical protein